MKNKNRGVLQERFSILKNANNEIYLKYIRITVTFT